MALDNAKNFAKVTVSTGYDASATSIILTGGHGTKLPTVPFNAVWWNSTDYLDPSDDPNVEIVRVTNISTDTLTVTRGQESVTATTKNTGGKTYKMIAGLTAKTINTDLAVQGSDTQVIFNDGGTYAGDANFTYNKTSDNVSLGSPTLVSTAKMNIKVTTGNSYNLFLEGTGGVVVPTIGFKHTTDSTGVAFTGNDSGFAFSNIGEGQTLFMIPGYPDAYWKTHGSLAAIFHFQSHDGSSYLDSHVIKGGLNAFGHATPDRLMHPEIADAVTNAVTQIQRLTHVSSGTVANGFGIGQEIELENASGTNRVVATQEFTYSDATDASEDATYKIRLIKAGTLADAVTVNSLGAMTLAAGLTVTTGDIVVSANASKLDFTGTGANGGVLKNLKNAAATALSGTQKDIEIDIGGTPYYFTVYPTKA